MDGSQHFGSPTGASGATFWEVSRTIARQVEEGRSCKPFPSNTHYPLKHEANAQPTFCKPSVSIVGIGAFDFISKRAMLQGYLRKRRQGPPFCEVFIWVHLIFVGSPKTFHKEREESRATPWCQWFAPGQHRALVAIQERLREGERVIAFSGRHLRKRGSDTFTPSSKRSCLPVRGSQIITGKTKCEPWRGPQ